MVWVGLESGLAGNHMIVQEESSLNVREWLAVVLFILLSGSLTTISYLNQSADYPRENNPPFFVRSQEIAIHVDGAVVSPGVYWLQKGATMGDLMKVVEFLPDADISKLDKVKTLRKKQKVKIPHQKMKKGSQSFGGQDILSL